MVAGTLLANGRALFTRMGPEGPEREDSMSRTIISTLALLAIASVGCFRTPDAPGVDGSSYSPPPDEYGRSTGSLMVAGGAQRGDMGEIRGFDSAARDFTGYYDSTYANVRLDSVGSGWWVMSAINISGDLAGPDFAPGTTRTFTNGVYSEGEPTVSVTGCSGPEYGNYTFDAPSGDVEISVQSLPGGMRRMNYTVRFADGLATHGSFDYRIEGTRGTVSGGI